MTYDPTVPDLPNEVTTDIPKMHTNANVLNVLFGKDHVPFSPTIASSGYHSQLTFPALLNSAPNLVANLGILYPFQDQNDTSPTARAQLFWKNVTEIQQITNRFHNIQFVQPAALTSNYGYWMLPGSVPPLILMWGFQALDTDPNGNTPWSSTHIVHFNPIANYVYTGGQTFGFPNKLLYISAQIANQDSSPIPAKTVSIDAFGESSPGVPFTNKEQFRIKLSSLAISGIYYLAIGN